MINNNLKINSYLDKISLNMEINKHIFYQKWNEILNEKLQCKEQVYIEEYLNEYGGWRISKSMFYCMADELQDFFSKHINIIQETLFLRGYDYYYADPLMHRKTKQITSGSLWKLFLKKQKQYSFNLQFIYLESSNLSIEDWIGTIAFAEYFFNDLSTLTWFNFLCKNQIKQEYKEVVHKTEYCVSLLSEVIAGMLLFDFKQVACTFRLFLKEYEYIVNRIPYMLNNNANLSRMTVRSLREGDSLGLLVYMYMMKVMPFFIKNKYNKVCFFSNAFGAVNTGVILKHLMKKYCNVDAFNIVFSQNRAVEDCEFGDGKGILSNCQYMNSSYIDLSSYDAIFIVDDSVFTGKSYIQIRKFLNNLDNIYLLPMTLNCDCLKYCKRGISKADNMEDIVNRVVNWSIEVNEILPGFQSFWDFERKAIENKIITDNIEYKAVLNGDDLLVKHLWTQFNNEIFEMHKVDT